jgi:hypothetical protein
MKTNNFKEIRKKRMNKIHKDGKRKTRNKGRGRMKMKRNWQTNKGRK